VSYENTEASRDFAKCVDLGDKSTDSFIRRGQFERISREHDGKAGPLKSIRRMRCTFSQVWLKQQLSDGTKQLKALAKQLREMSVQ
jgi:hypothetical protein